MKDNIVNLVEEAINNDNYSIYNYNYCGDVEEYIYTSGIRVVKTWDKMKKNEASKMDFECCLRNFLMLVNTEIKIVSYIPSEAFVSFGLIQDMNTFAIFVSDYLPSYINDNLVKQAFMRNIECTNKVTNSILTTNPFIQQLTGRKFVEYKSEEQKMCVTGALKTPGGYTTLISMSTGGGKSLVTQAVSYQTEGLTIVILPTISLMLDQYNNAKSIIDSDVDEEIFYYHSGCDLTPFLSSLEKKKARLLFISPESILKNEMLKLALNNANERGYLKNIIVDEAHIIIEWGSSFRIAFQCLDAIRKSYLRNNPNIRTFLLSATYSDETIRQLKLFYSENDKWIEIRCDRLRHELRYDIIKANSKTEKGRKIHQLVGILPHPMIIYVKSPDDAEELKMQLIKNGYKNIRTFTGNTPSSKRDDIINEWKNNDFNLMIATCAFGVGVDKRDVRTVLHTYIPENPNKYYQEAGRGGRDGLPCLSVVVYTEEDVEAAFSLLSKVITTEKLVGRWFSMLRSNKTKSLMDNKYIIDTYVKPNYNEDDVFADSISNQDVNWNVYVILLLRRNNLVKIDDVQHVNEKYVFYIELLDRCLLSENEETVNLLDKIRNTEWENTEKEFMLMKHSLHNIGKICWSSMFNKVYRRTDEYCAGCNSHIDIQNYEDRKVLRKRVDNPRINFTKKIDELSYGSIVSCVICRNDTLENFINFIDYGFDVVVAPKSIVQNVSDKISTNNKGLIYCDYMKFLELLSESRYYVSGGILIYFPSDTILQKRIIGVIEKQVQDNNSKSRYVIYAEKNYELPFKEKPLSDIIAGPCREI